MTEDPEDLDDPEAPETSEDPEAPETSEDPQTSEATEEPKTGNDTTDPRGEDGAGTDLGGTILDRFEARVPDSSVARILLGAVVLALAGRLLLLGSRTAHWDEGRVAFWVLRYAKTGFFEYRSVVHGPFLFQVDKYLFRILGANDFVARLPVAVVGGLLPAAAWLFRDRLRDAEVVALGALLALNPLLVYYSRFVRNDVLVAAFMLFALGFVVRAYDTRRARYLYGAAATVALAFTAKENAVVYLACWLGAGTLLVDHRLLDLVDGTDANLDGTWIRSVVRRNVPATLLAGFFLAANPLAFAVAGVVDSAVLVTLIAFAFVLGPYLGLLVGSNPWHYVGVVPLSAYLIAVWSGGLTPVGTIAFYGMIWLLVGALILDVYLFTPHPGAGGERSAVVADGGGSGASGVPGLRRITGAGTGTVRRFPPMLGAYLLFFAVLALFYAPRNPDPGAVGLWSALTDPTMVPALVEEALVGSGLKFYNHWIAGAGAEFDVYLERLRNMLRTMASGAGVLSGFAVVGFVYDRWSSAGPRDLVALAGYWGVVSVLGYPYGTDIWAPWIAVHAVVPLAIPAAVGMAGLYRWGDDALDRDDAVTAALAGGLLLALAVPVAVTAVDVAYVNSDGHERVLTDLTGGEQAQHEYVLQWAQAGNGLKGTLGTVDRVATANEGTDVLFYGSTLPGDDATMLYVPDERVCLDRPPVHEPRETCLVDELSWHDRLPLPWYLESYGATVESTLPEEGLDGRSDSELPPVVIGYGWNRSEIAAALPDRYEAHEHRFKLWGEQVVVFVDRTAVPGR